jgi:hypothetical protein
MAVDGERSIHVLSPFDGLTGVGFVRSTPVVARRTPGVVLATYEVRRWLPLRVGRRRWVRIG